ncbi:hypothetical protein FRC09_002728 [Ceratobasidium sp. 395]|nr:hypothetical protein FRC09_002728 [Ceratobasidium sp. 395]
MTWVFLWSCLALAVTLVLELALLPVLVAVLLGYLAIVLAIAAAAAALFVAFVALFVTLGTIFVIGWLGYEAICWLWRRCHRRRVETRTPQAEPIPGSGLSLHPEANSQPTTSSPPVDSTVDETRTAVSSVSTTVQMFNIALRTWGNNKNLPLATIRATMTTVRTLEAMTRSAGSWLYQPKRLIRITESLLDDSDPRAAEVLMDSVTSDMIAWILTESQDIKSIDIALQAVSGASSLLPLRPLALPQAIDLVDSQLSCFKQLNEGQCKDKGITILSKALTYCRTYKILALDSKSRQPWDRWKSSNPQQNSANVLEFIGLYTGLLDAVHRDKRSNQDLEIAAAIAAMPFCHWGHNASVDLTEKLEIAPKIIAARLRDYLTTENSEATLCRLVDSTAHYLIGLLPRRGLRFEHSLPTLLVQAFLLTRDSSSEVDYDAATILSATAFALYPYQGGETRSQDVDAREKRALKVLTHYKTRQPNVSEATKPPAPGSAPLTLRQRIVRRAQEMEKTSAQVMEQAMEQGMAQAAQTDDTTAGDSKMTKLNVLFAFGFLGVLHEIDFEYLAQADIDKLSTLFLEVTETCGVFNAPGQPQTSIHTLPNNVSLRECVILAAYRCLLAISDPYHTPRSVSTNIQRSFELFLWPNLGDGRGDPRLYFLALSTLCYAGSEEIRGCCMDLIAQQPISTDPFRHLVNSYDGQNLLTRLCYSLRDTNSSRLVPLVLGKFRLLVAHIMLARDISLPDRKAALLPLLECASYLGELHLDPHETNDRLPDEKSILHHVKRSEGESGPNSILRTMRLIFRFCHAASDTSADVAPIWQERLNELREHFSTKNFAAIAHPRQESSLVWDDTWAPLSEDTL